MMAITTGARRGELLGLSWRHVDLERKIAYVNETKNGQPKTLTLTPPVVAELERELAESRGRADRFRRDHADTRIFPARWRPTEPWKFELRWRAALAQAKITGFRFHDLRHTCASYLAQNGASLLEIADVMGHRQLAMVKRYAHLTTDSKAKLVNRVLGEIK
jgi:integrase